MGVCACMYVCVCFFTVIYSNPHRNSHDSAFPTTAREQSLSLSLSLALAVSCSYLICLQLLCLTAVFNAAHTDTNSNIQKKPRNAAVSSGAVCKDSGNSVVNARSW